MDTSNIIALSLGGISFIISIISLILTPILNLKSKRLEKRLEYRFELFKKILELWEQTNKNPTPDIKTLLLEINKLIQLYGRNSEIKLFKEVVDSYNYYANNKDETNRQKLIEKFNEFFSMAFNKYREEITLEKLQV